ncbi:MAG: dicarboxylate/amino acid:cation symporter [Spiroplasma poulsonii]|uniref:Transmembrane protein n=1 Tax=Spiroplasma poulsonii TaxID=2138 RepID=A0A2P6FAA7_9MOLU|nr:hypothetical protein [Spiroplasma poulsonii]KAF0852042.1 putative transmembrane protein [Spiroplasma poulsonii]MBW1241847.1 dicarboxylate/amino acid:cation symporter [Spiroplasma poulsonii]PQM30395.1 hypothetical protein SMSRO_SF001570 [Spiroplasma poulsonii]PWF95365.1 hypothetical protein SMSE_07910 [Spiroplasma poulsonii]PWF98149.1 hypothetical protein SMH99_07000 [Spiroplasma poulsonii]
MFTFLVTLGWVLIIIGAIVQIFAAILNLLVIQQVALPIIFNSINDIFQTSIFKQEEILNGLTGDAWAYTINALSIFVALAAITLVSFQINRVKKGKRIARPYIKMIFVTLIIASLVYGKVAVLIFAAFIFVALLFIESSLFDVEALQNFVEERNMIVIYHQDKKLEREVNKEGKYYGNATMGVGLTTAGIENTGKNFRDNDYVSADDNKKSSAQKSNAMFTSNELNNLFNSGKSDVDENELANLISDMTHVVSNPSNSEVSKLNDLTKPPLPTELIKDTPVEPVKVEEPLVATTVNVEPETSALEGKTVNVPITETNLNSDHAVNADVELFVDKTAVLEENDNLNDEEQEEPTRDKEIDFDFLNDGILNSSSSDARVLTKKEKKLYNKWNEMYQQALNIKNLIEEEVQNTNAPTKSIKKKAKIYNLIAKEANSLVTKLKLDADQHLKMMHIAEIFGDISQATSDFLNENAIVSNNDILDNISNETSSSKEDNDILDSLTKTDDLITNDLNIGTDDGTVIFGTTVATEIVQDSPQEDLTFIPKNYNIDKLDGELLSEIQSSDSQTQETINYIDDSHGYTFAELEGLDDLHSEGSPTGIEDKGPDAEIITFENNEYVETMPEELAAIDNNSILDKPSESVLATAEKIASFNAPIEENKMTASPSERPLVNNLENINDELVDDHDNNDGELLDDVIVSEPIKSVPSEIKSTQSEIKPALDDEISYSLDELDNKIMNGDFSNLDYEVIGYEIEQKDPPVVETTPVKQKLEPEQGSIALQPEGDNNFDCRFEKLEDLIKNSIDLQSVHTKTLGEVQEHLTSLTLKVETLETKSTDFAKKIADVETKKYVNYYGVVPIDQFYPQIDDLNLASTRYNLYNKKGYSNTYGATSASDVPYGSGSYYRAKNLSSGQDEMMINNNPQVDYNHLNLHNISKYTKQDIPYESNCPFCKKNSK